MDTVILVVFVNEEAYLIFLETETQCVLIQKKEIIHIPFGKCQKIITFHRYYIFNSVNTYI